MTANKSSIFPSDKIIITGGAGFLGSFVQEELHRKGYSNLVIPRRKDYDLTREADVARLYTDHHPDVIESPLIILQ